MMKKIISYVLIITLLLTSISVAYGANEAKQSNETNGTSEQAQERAEAQAKEEKRKNDATQKEIDEIQKQITKAHDDLAALDKEIAEQNVKLNKRLRIMYENGDAGILQVLLGSSDVTDFLTNMDMIQKIFYNNLDIIKTLEVQQQKIEVRKNELEKLQSQIIEQLESEASQISVKILSLQGDEEYTGGEFVFPVPKSKKITSPFGYRMHPILKITKLHTGIDIAAASGKDIVAANNGTVIVSGWGGGYGNVVVIDHGGGIATLYAHNKDIEVFTGDVVSKGQVIAHIGSTGMSTGPHLHFEVRVNGECSNPATWLK